MLPKARRVLHYVLQGITLGLQTQVCRPSFFTFVVSATATNLSTRVLGLVEAALMTNSGPPLKTKYKYWQNKLFLQPRYYVLNKHFIGTIW